MVDVSNDLGLIADIGATNARFAIAGPDVFHSPEVFQCSEYEGLAEAALAYMDHIGIKPGDLKKASFSIAGPVKGDSFKMTNHPWTFSIERTKLQLGLDSLHLMNDFRAIALSIPHLKTEDVYQVGGGQPTAKQSIGIVGPGTGLGVAALIWDEETERYLPVSGEGGHVTAPAKTQREYDVFKVLRRKYRHVSAERVCSGKGLVNVYDAIKELDGRDDLPAKTAEEISTSAIAGDCAVCVEALDMMMDFLGVVSGNLALTIGAFGGIYIAGGITAKLGDHFEQSRFREFFLSKGRFEQYLSQIPTFVIQNNFSAFVGLQADLKART